MFKQMESNHTQRLQFFSDPNTGLQAIVAIHSTCRGPAIGGCRFITYSNESDAITDALRLAKGMSYKAALAGLPHGGAKAVIIRPEGAFNRNALMQKFGQCIDSLGGDYITAMDSGTQIADMDQIRKQTRFVTCTTSIGDPSPFTAQGVFEGIKASAKFKLKTASLSGIHVSIQGLGHVGFEVARLLHEAGAILTVTDINPKPLELCQHQFNAEVVKPEDIYRVASDIFCPCGLGAIINDQTIADLNVKIVAGSANNQLQEERHGDLLAEKGILYAPDYLINSGGLIFVASRYAHLPNQSIKDKVGHIGPALLKLYQEAEKSESGVHRIANHHAESILAAAEKLNSAA